MRLFVAVQLPAIIRERIEELEELLPSKGLKKVDPALAHMTLKFLGEVPDRQIDEVIDALRSVKLPPFNAVVKGVGTFPSKKNIRVLWVGCTGEFFSLAKQVEDTLEVVGFSRERKAFHPHITIARVKHPEHGIVENIRAFLIDNDKAIFGEFVVNSFELVKSTLTPSGPVYETVERFELGGEL
ncbi:MAG: RNA 2',3'-cyclic phosphodiesterase [Methermicoccaceae archaeon]